MKCHRIYYDSIQLLIDKSKELPILYESDAKDCVTYYLKNLNIQKEQTESAEIVEASVILSLFRECGWLLPKEMFKNVPNRYSVERVGDFIEIQMDKKAEITLKEKSLKSKEEAYSFPSPPPENSNNTGTLR